MTIFLDLRTAEEFAASSLKDAINVPLDDIFHHKIGVLGHYPLNTHIEYYHPLHPFDELILTLILHSYGFMNLCNRGNIKAEPLVYEYRPTTTIRSVERKEKRTSHEIFF